MQDKGSAKSHPIEICREDGNKGLRELKKGENAQRQGHRQKLKRGKLENSEKHKKPKRIR